MNVSMVQVFKAVDYANSHPDKYLNGTTNWCAAVAFDLNRQTNTAAQPPALQAEIERLKSAAETLARMGYTDNGGELWRPPLGKKPDFDLIDQLKARCDELERLCIDSREAIRVDAVLWPKSTVGQLKPRLDKALLSVAMPASASRVPGCADAAWLLYDSGLYDQHGIHVMPCATIIGKATAYVGYKPAESEQ